MILPGQTHFVKPIGAMQMQVDFYDQPPPGVEGLGCED
jgi:hemoglobin